MVTGEVYKDPNDIKCSKMEVQFLNVECCNTSKGTSLEKIPLPQLLPETVIPPQSSENQPQQEPGTLHPPQQEPGTLHPPQQEPGIMDPPQQEPGIMDPPQQEPGIMDPPQQEPGIMDPPQQEPGIIDPPQQEPGIMDPPQQEPGMMDPPQQEPDVKPKVTPPFKQYKWSDPPGRYSRYVIQSTSHPTTSLQQNPCNGLKSLLL